MSRGLTQEEGRPPPLARLLGVTSLAPADWGMIGLLELTPPVIGQAIMWAAAGPLRAR